MDSLYNLDVDYLFIDEISMLQEIFYKFIIMIKRIKPNVKFIIAGVFSRLPPVKDRFGKSFNNSKCQALL
jgi:ATP-dependent exoDNAse (exonuclease V) alpha subunit